MMAVATIDLRSDAERFVSTYNGGHPFLRKMCDRLKDVGSLTVAQQNTVQTIRLELLQGASPHPLVPPTPIRPKVVEPVLLSGTYTVPGAALDGRPLTIDVQGLTIDECAQFNRPLHTQRLSVLSGPNNEADYTRFGWLEGSEARLWYRFRNSPQLLAAVERILARDPTVKVSTRCHLCSRKLTVPESIARGIGPICAEKWG